MKIKVDKDIVSRSVFLTATSEYGDQREYYEVDGALILCRNGHSLNSLINRVVDARIGWDNTYPGFTTDESRIGQRRTKITIFRPLRGRWYKKKLSEILNEN